MYYKVRFITERFILYKYIDLAKKYINEWLSQINMNKNENTEELWNELYNHYKINNDVRNQ